MATIKVFLEPHETEQDAREMLYKALEPDGQHQEDFQQPAAKATYQYLMHEHSKMWKRMLKEISEVLNEEVS